MLRICVPHVALHMKGLFKLASNFSLANLLDHLILHSSPLLTEKTLFTPEATTQDPNIQEVRRVEDLKRHADPAGVSLRGSKRGAKEAAWKAFSLKNVSQNEKKLRKQGKSESRTEKHGRKLSGNRALGQTTLQNNCECAEMAPLKRYARNPEARHLLYAKQIQPSESVQVTKGHYS